MNKKKIVALIGSVAMTASAAMSLWNLEDGAGNVSTSGYWFAYDDNDESADNGPGASTSDFPEGSMESDVVGPALLERGGKVNFTINPTTYKYPFAGIGFNWLDPEGIYDGVASKTGLCVEYTLTGDVPVSIEIKVDPASLDGYNAFAVKMPAQSTSAKKTFAFSAFAQESGWGEKLTIAQALQASSGIKFKAQLKTPPASAKSAVLTITSIGWAPECTGGPISNLETSSAVGLKLVQNGRSLSFRGLTSSANVEIINMQGQLVSRESIGVGSKSMLNLSKLTNGVYMLRVSGEKVNFSQRIVLQ